MSNIPALRVCAACCAVAALFAGGCAARAEVGIESLAPGAEIRATHAAHGTIAGPIVRQVNGYLDIAAQPDGSPARIIVREMERLELRDGRDWQRSGLLGMTGGFAVGVIGGMVCMRACPRTERGDRIFASIVGAAAGAPAGFLVGALVAPIRWTPVIVR
jgi:hypothetical protein